MRRLSPSLILVAAAAVASGCSIKKPEAVAASPQGIQKGVAGQYYYVNLFNPPVGGVVTSDLGGIDCGASGVTVNSAVTPPQYVPSYYAAGASLSNHCGQTRLDWAQQVVLTATARDGNAFIGWAGDCGGTGTCTLSAGADKTVVAIFGPPGGGHANILSPGLHGPAYLAFRAKAGGALKCDTCHGATLDGLGIAPSCNACHAQAGFPDWLNNCTFCHSSPPPPPHAQSDACGGCHLGYSKTGPSTGTVNPATHMNGVVDLAGQTCTSCHGTAGVNPAPPADTAGHTATTFVGVGAHQAHVRATLTTPIACSQCHGAASASYTTTHSDGTVQIGGSFFGPLANQGTATVWNGASCAASYCHGGTSALTGGTATTPIWTVVDGSQKGCTSCHGNPPPAPHAQNDACGTCHAGYSKTGPTTGTVNAATHVNGVVDLASALTCTSCHGTAGVNPAPPADTAGHQATGFVGVGAHQAHVAATLATPLACTECHGAASASYTTTHSDGTVQIGGSFFGPLANQGTTTVWNGSSCAASYCHGGTAALTGGTATAPVWTTVDGSQKGCTSCHGNPPPAPHAQNDACGTCHAGYSKTGPTTGTVNPATHVDGHLDVGTLTCTSCHGDPARSTDPVLAAMPPRGTGGQTLPTQRGVGAHAAHLTAGPLAGAFACTDCHNPPTSTSHATGAVQFSWSPLATGGGKPAFNPTDASCASTYCHGNFPGGNGANTPVWTAAGTGAACGSCHGLPPAAPHSQSTACGSCHGAGYSLTTVNAATHVNGLVEQVTLSCTTCHGTTGVNAAPPADTAGHTATTFVGVGAHQAHVVATLSAPIACTECHGTAAAGYTPTHADGTVQIGGSFFGPLANQGTSAVWNGASCAASYCHGGSSALQGGTATTPVWTTVDGSQKGCTSCHGNPPPAPHQQRDDCGTCHPGYAKTGPATGTVVAATHVDGHLDVVGLSCTTCHGDANRTAVAGADANVKAAPPADTHGNLTAASPGVGAHAVHVNGTRSRPVACSECHGSLAAYTTSHSDGVTPIAFGALGGASGAAFNGDLTCSSTYCHGNFKGGSTATTPAWTTAGTLGCTACHGSPPAAGHVARTDCGTCHPGYTSSSVVAATHIDGKVDLDPSLTCSTCHTSYAMAGTASYHHVMGTDAPGTGTTYPLNNSPATTALADKSCLECHVRHDLFGAPGQVMRSAITGAVTAVSDDAALCISCHTNDQVKDQTRQKSDATTATDGWASGATAGWTASGGAGGHNYAVAGTFQPGSAAAGAFTVNCTKCHNSSAPTEFQTGTARFSLHESADRRLRAPLGQAAADNNEETFCYRCHSAASDALGGTMKSSTPLDWYGGQAMPAGATGLYLQMAKVSTGSGHNVAGYAGLHRPNPGEETLQVLAANKHVECADCHDPHQVRRGNQSVSGTVTSVAATTLSDTTAAWIPGAWVGYSVDVATTTAGTTWVRGQITANTATALTYQTLTTVPTGLVKYRIGVRANGGAVTAATATTLTDGQTAVGAAKAWATNAWAGWTVNIVLGAGAGQSVPIVSNTGTVLTVAGWSTTPGTTSRYVISKLPNVMTGATGVDVSAWGSAAAPTVWGASNTFNPAAGSATPLTAATTQWQVCFKCHSAANASLTTWKSTWSNLAQDLNPNNLSYHPIVAPAAAAAGTGIGNTQLTATYLTNGWKPGDVMTCSDCHGNDTTTAGASQGPHASAVKFLLRGVNTMWPTTTTGGTTRFTTNNYTTGQGTAAGLFCLNCHNVAGVGIHTRSEHANTACTGCHIVIPHGGKVKRLMRTTNTPAPYIDVAGSATTSTATWPTGVSLLKAYSGGTSDNSTSCGAACTTHHNLTPNSTAAPVNAW